MTTQHTPGPWQRLLAHEAKDKRPPYNVWTIVGNTDADERKQSTIATTITDDADARLIAAAPELLEACEALMTRFVGDGNSQNCAGPAGAAADKARAAIQKARGQ